MKPNPEPDPWSHLVLPARVKESLLSIRRAIQDAASKKAPDNPGANVLIYGPPGTGKTQIIGAFRPLEGVTFKAAGALDFKGGFIGQSGNRVREVFEQARETAPCILYIDMEQGPYSDDCLFAPRSSTMDQYADEIILETLVQLEGLKSKPCPVFIIAETFHRDRVDPAVLSRFDLQIELPLPDETDRQEILNRKIRQFPTDPSLDVDEVSAILARNSAGDSGRALDAIIQRAWHRGMESASDPDNARLTRQSLLAGIPTAVSDICAKLGLSEEAQKQLEVFATMLGSIRTLEKHGIQPPRFFLNGTADIDSMNIAAAVATAGAQRLLAVHGRDLKRVYTGQASMPIRDLFERAQAQSPCLLFIEGIDSIAVKRGDPNCDELTNEIVNELLFQMTAPENRQIVLMASANDPERLDSAVYLRFTNKVHLSKRTPMAKIEIVQGDITKQSVDAIVNAANSSLLGGGGVDGAIHQASGPQLFEECRTLSGCATGEAKITKGYRLPAKFVIHTVGPVYQDSPEDARLLANCYRNSLRIANERGLKSIAFPSISTGAFGFPLHEACRVALRTTKEVLGRGTTLERVIFVAFSYTDQRAYEQAHKEIFPESM